MKAGKIKHAVTVLAIMSVVGFCANAQASLVVDPFEEVMDPNPWPLTMDTIGSSGDIVEFGLSSVLGDVRITNLTVEALDVIRLDEVQVGVYASPGILTYSSSVLADGKVELFYTGGGALNADLSSDLWLEIDVLGFDLAGGNPMDVTVVLTDGAGNNASITHQVMAPGRQLLQFTLGSFTKLGGVDLTDVDLIAVTFDPGFGGDFRIGEITTDVPEPATLCLLLAGGFFVVRRRR